MVTYPNDGTNKEGLTGPFFVQSITIIGEHRSLPTINIASQFRTFAASGVISKDVFKQIDFGITDQTAHNSCVDELVAQRIEHIPDQLFCNVYTTLMFKRLIAKI